MIHITKLRAAQCIVSRVCIIEIVAFLLGAAVLALAAAAAAATVSRIDDSATVVLESTPQMVWRSTPPRNNDNAIIGRTRVNIRLATAPWLGKTGRIYMRLPADAMPSIKVAWRTQGRLLDGELVAGGRTLVYAGLVRDARLEDVFDLGIEADGTRVGSLQRLQFYFEIELD